MIRCQVKLISHRIQNDWTQLFYMISREYAVDRLFIGFDELEIGHEVRNHFDLVGCEV